MIPCSTLILCVTRFVKLIQIVQELKSNLLLNIKHKLLLGTSLLPMLLFLPILLCCSALKIIILIMLNIILKYKNCGQTIMLFMYNLVETITYM